MAHEVETKVAAGPAIRVDARRSASAQRVSAPVIAVESQGNAMLGVSVQESERRWWSGGTGAGGDDVRRRRRRVPRHHLTVSNLPGDSFLTFFSADLILSLLHPNPTPWLASIFTTIPIHPAAITR